MTFIIDPADMSRPRSPDDLVRWVDEYCQRLGSSSEAKTYARSGDEMPKKFYEEVRPLAIYAQAAFGQVKGAIVTPNLGDDPYDGIIELPDRTVYVEITANKDGYADSLRMEALTTNGHVNAISPITAKGRRHSPSREVTAENVAVDHDETVNEHLVRIEKRISAKADDRYTRNHHLLVTVDDYIPFREADDIRKLQEAVYDCIQPLPLMFAKVVVVGESGRILFEIDVPVSASP